MTTAGQLRAASRLAIDGGSPAITQPLPPMFPGGMRLDRQEEQAVLEVLRSKRLFRYYGPHEGPSQVDAFEGAFASAVGANGAVAVSSGFAALMCGLSALDIGPGDEVIVPAYTWIASAEAVIALGAVPIIAEIDESLTLDLRDVEAKITPFTRAIMPVHMRGAPAPMDGVMRLAQRHGLKVIEDVAQAVGGSFQGRPLGSIGDVGAFSFQFNKIITCGEGGAAVSGDSGLQRRMVMYHDVIGGARSGIAAHDMRNGMNFRMGELPAAILNVQLCRLPVLLGDMRRHNAAIREAIADVMRSRGVALRTLHDASGDTAIALVLLAPTAERAAAVSGALHAEGVGNYLLYEPQRQDFHVYAHWTPVLQKRMWSDKAGPWRNHPRPIDYSYDMCPRSLDLLGRAVHLDISPDLSPTNVEQLGDALRKVLTALL